MPNELQYRRFIIYCWSKLHAQANGDAPDDTFSIEALDIREAVMSARWIPRDTVSILVHADEVDQL